MEIVYLDGQKVNIVEPICSAIGFFDGLHIGHMALVNEVKRVSEQKGYKKALMTFDHYPLYVLGKIKEEKYLTTFARICSSSIKPEGRTRDIKKFVTASPKSANSLFKNQSRISLHLATFNLAPRETISTCFSKAISIFSLLVLGIPARSNVS